ncbi:Gfo/Idh/MocA family protein [Haloprofundus halophilus]|uniref:Gfo/Idh/MocA family protein n=1 Tax=Haloprofundus halophilus TaxID=2283527 RepID=UPI000E42FE30|nr:Gfo/Idh/MocA family oxidoreductase [Haloprofundus halophilus]
MVTRIGAIGVGGMGHLELHYLDDLADVDVVACADVSAGARSVFESDFEAPAYDDYRTLLDERGKELDGVVVASPHAYHYDHATACLEAGIDVLLEKPMTVDVADALSLVETAERCGQTLQIGYQRRFHPAFRAMRNIVDSGRIGDVHTVACHIGQDWITPHQGTWRVDPALSGGGQLYDTGSHLLDAVLWITDSNPESVAATVEYAAPGVDVSAALSVRLDRNGRQATASIAVTGDGTSMDPREGYVVWGSRGSLVYTGDRLYVEHKSATRYAVRIREDVHFDTVTRDKMRHFADVVAGRASPAVPAEGGLQVVALTEAAYQSADEERVVEVQTLVDAAERSLS